MARAYSQDWRDRVIDAALGGLLARGAGKTSLPSFGRKTGTPAGTLDLQAAETCRIP